jgi:hypothetical protein
MAVPVVDAAPGIFNTPAGNKAAFLNVDLSVNNSANPAAKACIVVLFATGEGQTDPAGVDGKICHRRISEAIAAVQRDDSRPAGGDSVRWRGALPGGGSDAGQRQAAPRHSIRTGGSAAPGAYPQEPNRLDCGGSIAGQAGSQRSRAWPR